MTTQRPESTAWIWLRMIALFAGIGLAIGYLSGCDDADTGPDAPPSCLSRAGEGCPDAGADAADGGP
jgi:hypothetical protein